MRCYWNQCETMQSKAILVRLSFGKSVIVHISVKKKKNHLVGHNSWFYSENGKLLRFVTFYHRIKRIFLNLGCTIHIGVDKLYAIKTTIVQHKYAEYSDVTPKERHFIENFLVFPMHAAGAKKKKKKRSQHDEHNPQKNREKMQPSQRESHIFPRTNLQTLLQHCFHIFHLFRTKWNKRTIGFENQDGKPHKPIKQLCVGINCKCNRTNEKKKNGLNQIKYSSFRMEILMSFISSEIVYLVILMCQFLNNFKLETLFEMIFLNISHKTYFIVS